MCKANQKRETWIAVLQKEQYGTVQYNTTKTHNVTLFPTYMSVHLN